MVKKKECGCKSAFDNVCMTMAWCVRAFSCVCISESERIYWSSIRNLSPYSWERDWAAQPPNSNCATLAPSCANSGVLLHLHTQIWDQCSYNLQYVHTLSIQQVHNLECVWCRLQQQFIPGCWSVQKSPPLVHRYLPCQKLLGQHQYRLASPALE